MESYNYHQGCSHQGCSQRGWFLIVLLIVFATPQSLIADTLGWKGGIGINSWYEILNWDNQTTGGLDRVPTVNDSVTIPRSDTPLSTSALITGVSSTAKTRFLTISANGTLNHRSGTLETHRRMGVLGKVNLNSGTNDFAKMNNKDGLTISAGGTFSNFGGEHVGSGETLRIWGTYKSIQTDSKLTFSHIIVEDSGATSGVFDWDAGTLTTNDITLRGSGRWDISQDFTYDDDLTMEDTCEIELRGNGGVLATLTLSSTSVLNAVAGQIDGNLIISTVNIDLDGEIEILGTFSQLAAGKTTAQLGPGTDSGKFTVTGTASLDGDLVLELDSLYTPSAGDTFTIISASSVSGTFAAVTVPLLSNDLTVTIIYNTDSVVAKVEIPGDINEDGFVGLVDINYPLSHWNQNVTVGDALSGDVAGPGVGNPPDGYVGIDDLNFVIANWNKGVAPPLE